MRDLAKNIRLPSIDDLFSTEEERQDAKLEKIQLLPLSELHPFEGHPFQVRDDEEMDKMVDSVKEYGVMSPAIVRPRRDGGYEIVPALLFRQTRMRCMADSPYRTLIMPWQKVWHVRSVKNIMMQFSGISGWNMTVKMYWVNRSATH